MSLTKRGKKGKKGKAGNPQPPSSIKTLNDFIEWENEVRRGKGKKKGKGKVAKSKKSVKKTQKTKPKSKTKETSVKEFIKDERAAVVDYKKKAEESKLPKVKAAYKEMAKDEAKHEMLLKGIKKEDLKKSKVKKKEKGYFSVIMNEKKEIGDLRNVFEYGQRYGNGTHSGVNFEKDSIKVSTVNEDLSAIFLASVPVDGLIEGSTETILLPNREMRGVLKRLEDYNNPIEMGSLMDGGIKINTQDGKANYRIKTGSFSFLPSERHKAFYKPTIMEKVFIERLKDAKETTLTKQNILDAVSMKKDIEYKESVYNPERLNSIVRLLKKSNGEDVNIFHNNEGNLIFDFRTKSNTQVKFVLSEKKRQKKN